MSKNHDALPVPAIEVYARPMGKIQYNCPNCTTAHPLQMVNWRRMLLVCSNCHARYQIGLGFTRTFQCNSYLMGKWNSYVTNRIDPTGTPSDYAKLYGTVEWRCPDCLSAQRSFLDWSGQLECACLAKFYVSVLFYRLPSVSRLKLKAPFDSLVKGLHAPAKVIQPLSTAPIDSSTGTSSSSSGGDR